jgi:hypothetical protein
MQLNYSNKDLIFKISLQLHTINLNLVNKHQELKYRKYEVIYNELRMNWHHRMQELYNYLNQGLICRLS